MMTLRRIGAQDQCLHPAYCEFVRAVFPRAGFERWIDWGEWGPDYHAYALLDGQHIIANCAVSRMHLWVDGQSRKAWQLGAVGVRPEQRGHGYADRVLQAALRTCGLDPVLLFANPQVRNFYPRFGFVPWPEHIFSAEFSAEPCAHPAPALDPADPATRTLIHRLCAQGLPDSHRFGARAYGETLTWYLANEFAPPPRQLDAHTLVLCRTVGNCLFLDAVLALQQFDLRTCIARLIDTPIQRIEFGFTPDVWWPSATVDRVDDEADLFVRGLSPPSPQRFPILART